MNVITIIIIAIYPVLWYMLSLIKGLKKFFSPDLSFIFAVIYAFGFLSTLSTYPGYKSKSLYVAGAFFVGFILWFLIVLKKHKVIVWVARLIFLAIIVFTFLILFSGQVNGSDFSLGARYKTSNINIVEGAMFNNYWITHFELNAEWESSGIKLFANPYTYFKTVKASDYVEGGLLIGVKKNVIDIFDLTAKSLFFGWEEEGKWNRGFVLFGELEFNIFLNPRVVYAFGNIIDREDLSGSSIRLDFGGRIGTIRYKGKKVCVVESRRGLIYNHHFFRDQKGFIFTADVLLKELKIFGPFMTELFINWFYAKGIINRIMVGINIDLQILGKGD